MIILAKVGYVYKDHECNTLTAGWCEGVGDDNEEEDVKNGSEGGGMRSSR